MRTEWNVGPVGAVHYGLFFGDALVAKGPRQTSVDALAEIAAEANAYPRLISERQEMLAALQEAAKVIQLARRYFPKTVKHADRFTLENTCATVGAAIAKVQP